MIAKGTFVALRDAFVDQEIFPAVVARLDAAFEKALAEQTASAAGDQ